MDGIKNALMLEFGGLEMWKLLLFVVVFSVGFLLRHRFSWLVRRMLLAVFGRVSPVLRSWIQRLDIPLQLLLVVASIHIPLAMIINAELSGLTQEAAQPLLSYSSLVNDVFTGLYIFLPSLFLVFVFGRFARERARLLREKEYKTAASLMLLTGRILQALSLLAGGLLAFWVLGPDQVERILANIDDFLMNKVYGIRIWRVLVIALIVGIGVGFKKFFASNVMHILKNISSRTETTIDDYIIDAADKPAQLLSISASIHIASFFIPWSNWINTVVNGAVVADAVTINTIRDTINTGFMIIYICIAAYFVFRLVDKAATYGIELSEKKAKDKVPERTRFDATLIVTFRKFLKVIVVIFAAMMVLDRLGVDIRMVIASFTVASAAVAFAARDSIANVFGAFVLSIDRPFSLGDWIVAGGTEGTVEEIGLRSTQIRTFAKSLVSIPNNQLMNMTIDNMSKRPRQRVKATIGVKYSSDPEKVEQLVDGIKKLILENKNTWHDYYQIWFTEFGPSSLNILLYFFIESTVWEDFLRERQNIYLDIMRLVKDLELEFAFPSQTIYFDDPKALSGGRES